MYFLRLSFFVYCYYSSFYFHFFIPMVCSFDVLKKKTNIVDAGTCYSGDQKIQKLHSLTEEELNLYATAQWNYHTNRTEETTKEAIKYSIRLFLYQKLLIASANNMSEVFGVKYEELLPLLYFIQNRGICELDLIDFNTLIMLKSKLHTMINKLTVCGYQKTNEPCNVTAEEIQLVMVNSSDVAELKHYWKAWHNQTSFEVKNVYLKYTGVLNHMSKLNNYSNEYDYFMRPYSSEHCHLNVDRMYGGIRPLYEQLHTRVRKVLRDKFGTAVVSADGPIPVHLLGSMLGQPWTNLLPSIAHEFVVYEKRKTDENLLQSSKQLFDQANRYFSSIGMGCVPKSVWSNSVFVESEYFADCTPSSWDMYANNDFRIKMCFRDTDEDVYTMHKQLGLVHYFMAYKKQPISHQHTSDAAFVDGMMNALTLSVQYQDFIDRFNDSSYSRHSYLLRTALKKVSVLPFAYAADVWHANVFKGSFAQKRMNEFWWSKRLKYEGVMSPISKGKDKCTNSNYKPFDPSASYNALMELPPIRYFIVPIIEFQIFQALCKICGEYDSKNTKTKQLYECNLRGYKKIGKIIKSVMSKGSSMKWPSLFEIIVGHRRLEIEPLLEYFRPLHDHLYATNSETNEHIGWK